MGRAGGVVLDEIRKKREQLSALCAQHHVRRLAVFGSALSDVFDPTKSDVDLVVEFYPLSPGDYAANYFSLLRSLMLLFGRKVDLVSARNLRNPYFRRQVEAMQETVYAA